MKKTIIAIYGRAGEGKSTTIKNICRRIIESYQGVEIVGEQLVNYDYDIFLVLKIGTIKIGIESQGDPNSRMLKADSIRKLADGTIDPLMGGCDIIICACRTGGRTVKKVEEIANEYNYYTLWRSSYYAPNFEFEYFNDKAAVEVCAIISDLINGKI